MSLKHTHGAFAEVGHRLHHLVGFFLERLFVGVQQHLAYHAQRRSGRDTRQHTGKGRGSFFVITGTFFIVVHIFFPSLQRPTIREKATAVRGLLIAE